MAPYAIFIVINDYLEHCAVGGTWSDSTCYARICSLCLQRSLAMLGVDPHG
jgi:hypothetical protein